MENEPRVLHGKFTYSNGDVVIVHENDDQVTCRWSLWRRDANGRQRLVARNPRSRGVRAALAGAESMHRLVMNDE
jgi:hypothetical protein